MNCSELAKKLMATQTNFHSYKYEEIGEDLIGFKMITENATEVGVAFVCMHMVKLCDANLISKSEQIDDFWYHLTNNCYL